MDDLEEWFQAEKDLGNIGKDTYDNAEEALRSWSVSSDEVNNFLIDEGITGFGINLAEPSCRVKDRVGTEAMHFINHIIRSARDQGKYEVYLTDGEQVTFQNYIERMKANDY